MTQEVPVQEDELHAYIDNELPPERREVVAAWLAAHPEQAALVARWQAQAEAIRARYGAVVDEAIPRRLNLDALLRGERKGRRRWVAFAAAAAIAAFIVGGATGWFAASAAAPASGGTLTADALEAHRLYVVEVRHPVEVPGSERAHMAQWLSKRLGYQQRIPDLQPLGLTLVGGRLLPGPTGAAAFYMYEGRGGERFTLYCAKAIKPDSEPRFKAGERYAAYSWIDGKAAYVLSGPADRERLKQVSEAVYDQLEKGGAKL
jgi:anti-sigma factor RsiW